MDKSVQKTSSYRMTYIDSSEAIVFRRTSKYQGMLENMVDKLNSLPKGQSIKVEIFTGVNDLHGFAQGAKNYLKKANKAEMFCVGVNGAKKQVFIGRRDEKN